MIMNKEALMKVINNVTHILYKYIIYPGKYCLATQPFHSYKDVPTYVF